MSIKSVRQRFNFDRYSIEERETFGGLMDSLSSGLLRN